MDRVAIFVDAGYLFAQGSAALAGSRQPRHLIDLDIDTVVAELRRVADAVSPGLPLLRIYWYDGAAYRGPTAEHTRIGRTPDIKLRLGIVNSAGEQKGVDSLIVTDMIELARNKAMADALLLSGDGDILPGVMIAQSFGVRVHLLGIEPGRGSQSPQLRDEADTVSEWDRATVANLMALRPPHGPEVTADRPPGAAPGTDPPPLERIVAEFAGTLGPDDKARVRQEMAVRRGVPREIDRRLLATCGNRLGRDLDQTECRRMRQLLAQHLEEEMTQQPTPPVAAP